MRKFSSYIGKPIRVEAIKWTGSNFEEIQTFARPTRVTVTDRYLCVFFMREGLIQEAIALPGDWIIRGVLGHCYVCEALAFDKSYQKVKK